MEKLKILGVMCMYALLQCSPALAADKTVVVQSADTLNFNYVAETEKEKYMPQHIFDDGRKTYLLLPQRAEGKHIRIFGKRADGEYDLIRQDGATGFITLPGIYDSLQARIDEVLVEILRKQGQK